MIRNFDIVEATFPKKILILIIFFITCIFWVFLDEKYHLSQNYSALVGGIAFIIILLLMYFLFAAESFKRIGQITFANDYISINDNPGSTVFQLNEISNLRLVYNGVFGDTETNSLTSSRNMFITKDGSGNFFSFTKNGKEYIYNLVFENFQDVRAIKVMFENMKSNHNIDVQVSNKFILKKKFE